MMLSIEASCDLVHEEHTIGLRYPEKAQRPSFLLGAGESLPRDVG